MPNDFPQLVPEIQSIRPDATKGETLPASEEVPVPSATPAPSAQPDDDDRTTTQPVVAPVKSIVDQTKDIPKTKHVSPTADSLTTIADLEEEEFIEEVEKHHHHVD